MRMWAAVERVKTWIGGLSMRTGWILAALCGVCYCISFGQMLLPLSLGAKGVLWFVFFGLAKTFQYSALLILGGGVAVRLRRKFRFRRGA